MSFSGFVTVEVLSFVLFYFSVARRVFTRAYLAETKEYKHRFCFSLAVVYFIRSFHICRYFQARGDVSV